jgi:hypothetical protein
MTEKEPWLCNDRRSAQRVQVRGRDVTTRTRPGCGATKRQSELRPSIQGLGLRISTRHRTGVDRGLGSHRAGAFRKASRGMALWEEV